MKTNKKILFDLVDSIGENINNGFHIIDNSNEYRIFEGEKKYKIYHKLGYCFDIEKQSYCSDETGKFINWNYYFYSQYEGFKELNAKKAIKLFNSILKNT